MIASVKRPIELKTKWVELTKIVIFVGVQTICANGWSLQPKVDDSDGRSNDEIRWIVLKGPNNETLADQARVTSREDGRQTTLQTLHWKTRYTLRWGSRLIYLVEEHRSEEFYEIGSVPKFWDFIRVRTPQMRS
jgi:hypothetical protein